MNPLVLLPGLERRRKALRTDRDASQRAEHERLAREKLYRSSCGRHQGSSAAPGSHTFGGR